MRGRNHKRIQLKGAELESKWCNDNSAYHDEKCLQISPQLWGKRTFICMATELEKFLYQTIDHTLIYKAKWEACFTKTAPQSSEIITQLHVSKQPVFTTLLISLSLQLLSLYLPVSADFTKSIACKPVWQPHICLIKKKCGSVGNDMLWDRSELDFFSHAADNATYFKQNANGNVYWSGYG